MQKLLIAAASAALMTSVATAADFGVIAQTAPMAYAAPSDWTGFYAGVFGGVGGGDNTLTIDGGPGATAGFEGNSFGGLLGAQVGYDFQFDQFVIGAVADIAITNIESDSSVIGFGGPGGTLTYGSTLDYLGTVRARVGFAAIDQMLVYAHGGLAYGRTSPGFGVGGVPGGTPDLEDVNRWGYTVGAGVEYAFTDNLSLQTEYAYTDLGNRDVGVSGVALPPGTSISEEAQFHTVKAGLNFRF